MTKSEQAALEELHMTPEQLEQRKEKVAAMLEEEKPSLKAEVTAIREAVKDLPPPKPTRKKRSDAGVPKPKKPPESGCISAEQVARMEDLYETKQSLLAQLDAINDNQARTLASIDSITAEIKSAWLELQGKR